MDAEAAAVCSVVLCACLGVIAVATADMRAARAPSSSHATFRSTTFEQAMATSSNAWFHKKLRCDKRSFLRLYTLVHAACPRRPAANSKYKLAKRLVLTMIYLAQGGTIDHAATVLGISRPRAVVYINEMLDTLRLMSKTHVGLPTLDELEEIEEGFYRIADFPGVVGAIDGTLVAIARPKDYEGWYCRMLYPAVNVQAVVDHRGTFRSIPSEPAPIMTSLCGMDPGSDNSRSICTFCFIM